VAVIHSLVAHIQWRFKNMSKILSDFNFLHGGTFSAQSVNEVRRSAVNFPHKYKYDVRDIKHSLKIKGVDIL
jgi:hypothetical protein